MTNLSLPSDPQSSVPRHTVAEWFQMEGVCGRRGVAVRASSPQFQVSITFQAWPIPVKPETKEVMSIDSDFLVLCPNSPLTVSLRKKTVSIFHCDLFDWCRLADNQSHYLKQYQVLYVREPIFLFLSKSFIASVKVIPIYVRCSVCLRKGSESTLSNDFSPSYISPVPIAQSVNFPQNPVQQVWIR